MMLTTGTTNRPLHRSSNRSDKPVPDVGRLQEVKISEAEALELLARLRGPRYRPGYDHGIGCHNVDDVTAHFLTTIPRRDALWLGDNFDAERLGWPTASLLGLVLAGRSNREHTIGGDYVDQPD